jgi:hypothetical protein
MKTILIVYFYQKINEENSLYIPTQDFQIAIFQSPFLIQKKIKKTHNND